MVTFLSLFLSGCVVVEKIDSLNGILDDPVPDFEIEELKKGEMAFFAGNYQESQRIFTVIYKKSEKKIYQNYAVYGIACTKIMAAENIEEYIEAIKVLEGWKRHDVEIRGFWEDPRMITAAVNTKTHLFECEPEIKYVTSKKSDARVKRQKTEIKELKETIKKLQHQISVLEAIDQEIQEKRKPI